MSDAATILVVDDDPINRSVLFCYLDNLGHRVLTAGDGETAIEIVKREQPNLILMDVLLPGMDGYSALEQIHTQSASREIPVLFMSGLDDNQSRTETFAAGGSAHLTKPIVYPELDVLLKLHLERQRLAAQLSDSGKGEAVRDAVVESARNSVADFDRMIDYIAHDMKSALVGVSGFADELKDQFAEAGVVDEWLDFIGFMKKSAIEAGVLLESLVLLKELRTAVLGTATTVSVADLMQQVHSRYLSVESATPVHCRIELENAEILGQPDLLEELFLTLWRILAGLNPAEADWQLDISCTEDTHHDEWTIILDASTRPISEQELPLILAPIVDNKRRRVQDTNILTVCAQNLIEHLGICASAAKSENGLRFQLSLPRPTTSVI